MMVLDDLIGELDRQERNHRIGVALIPARSLGDIGSLHIKFNLATADLVEILLSDLSLDARYTGLSSTRLLQLIDAIAEDRHERVTVLVQNFDLLLARFDDDERLHIWRVLRTGLRKRRSSLLIAFPEQAEQLFPVSERGAWMDGRMLANL